MSLKRELSEKYMNYAPLRALNDGGSFTSMKEIRPQRPAGRAADPLVDGKDAAGGSFPGLGSNTQQAFYMSVYVHALLAAAVLAGIGIPAVHGIAPE